MPLSKLISATVSIIGVGRRCCICQQIGSLLGRCQVWFCLQFSASRTRRVSQSFNSCTIKYLQATKMQMSGSVCPDCVTVTTEQLHRDQRWDNTQTRNKEKLSKYIRQKEITQQIQVSFLLVSFFLVAVLQPINSFCAAPECQTLLTVQRYSDSSISNCCILSVFGMFCHTGTGSDWTGSSCRLFYGTES